MATEIQIADKPTLDAIKAKIDTNLDSKVSGVGNILTVQRGTTSITSDGGVDQITITISSVDLSKSFVSLNTSIAGGSRHYSLEARLTTPTTLVISVNQTGGSAETATFTISWQVIQFA